MSLKTTIDKVLSIFKSLPKTSQKGIFPSNRKSTTFWKCWHQKMVPVCWIGSFKTHFSPSESCRFRVSRSEFSNSNTLIGLGRRNCRHISTGIQTPPYNISTYIYVLQVTLVFILSISSLGIYFINTSRYAIDFFGQIINKDFLFHSFQIKSIILFLSIRHPVNHKIVSSPIQR